MDEGINNNNNRAPIDPQRILLQSFMSKQIMTDDTAKELLQRILTEYNRNQVDLEDFITALNNNLRFVYWEIRRAVSENDRVVYWGLVNTRSDKESQLATSYSLGEINLFKKIMEYVLTVEERSKDPRGEIGVMDAMNLAKGITGLTAQRSEHTINRLVKDLWLGMITKPNQEKKLTLGIRSMMELKSWMEEVFTLTECVVCSEPVIKGETCSNDKCEVRMHNYCAERWFSNKNIKKCPTCTMPWNR